MATAKKQPKTKTPAKKPAKKPVDPRDEFEHPRQGDFVEVVSGEYKGLYGAYLENTAFDKDGRPTQILVRNRDHANDDPALAVVNFEDARPTYRKGR